MAIPRLYWMLRCTGCGSRLVVRDTYLKPVHTSAPAPFRGGYEGPPLPERYKCSWGCSEPLKAVASIFDPDDETMWLYDPHVQVVVTEAQAQDWRRLIQHVGVAEERPANVVPSQR